MKIKDLAALHHKVVHEGARHSLYCQAYDHAHPDEQRPRYFTKKCDVCCEEVWIKKYPYDTLEIICSECFASPAAWMADHILDGLPESKQST